MSYEWTHGGMVRLKPDTTLQQVLNLFPQEEGTDPLLPLDAMGEVELADGHVRIEVEADTLQYQADGDSGWLDDDVETFLEAVAEELAAEGWIDYQIDDFEVAYGPSERARVQAMVESARSRLNSAQDALAAAEDVYRRLAGA